MRRSEATGRYQRGYPPDSSGAGGRRPPIPNRPSGPSGPGASSGGYGPRTSYGPARSSQRAPVPNYPNYPNRPSGPGGPGTSARLPNTDRDNPYRSYDPTGASARATYSRMSATGRFPVDMEEDTGLTSSRLEAVQRHRHGFALFHDGNAGHLWRGEVAAQFGDAIFSVGVVMWLAYLTGSPFMVALGVALLGLPWLLAGPLAAPLQNVREPGRALLWLGRLRALCALGLVATHFYTIYPAIYALIFLVALTGRLREGLRVAATRVCLEPGEPELISNDLYIGSALSATLGPLLATALFVGLGERIILIGVAAAICYLLSSNSDGFLDALPEKKRAFLLVTPTSATPDTETRDELLNAVHIGEDDLPVDLSEADDEPGATALALARRRRELALPEWYQQGPQTVRQALGELRTGVGLLGSGRASATALVNLSALAFVGGGLATLEVFYLLDRLGLPEYYLGALLAAEGAGLTLGALLAGLATLRQRALPLVLLGVALSGVALGALGYAATPPVALGAAVALGLANALAVTAARRALRIGFNGVERRAIGDAEAWLSALAGVLGALLFAVFYAGASAIPHLHALAKLPFKGLPIGELMLLTGAGLALVALFSLASPLVWRDKPAADEAADEALSAATNARLPGQLPSQTNARLGATRSGLGAAAGGGGLWDGAGDSAELDAVGGDDWDDAGDPSTYQSSYGAAYGAESGEYDQYDDQEDEPPTRRRW